jgi:hypothetical protein
MLRILVAAASPTAATGVDATAADDRELVCFAGLCDARTHERCRCDTSFLILRTRVSGIAAAVVTERDMTLDDYIHAFVASYVMAGKPDDGETLALASSEAIQTHQIAAQHPVGTVVKVHGDRVLAYRPKGTD